MASLATVIAAVESRNNAGAFRFERAVFDHLTVDSGKRALMQRIAQFNPDSSHDTCAMIAATSWGAYQVMGFNLYADDFPAPVSIARYLGNPLAQLQSFQWYTAKHHIDFGLPDFVSDAAKLTKLATLYNGPGNTREYEARVLDEIRRQQPELFAG